MWQTKVNNIDKKRIRKIISGLLLFGFGLVSAQTNDSENNEITEHISAISKTNGLNISPKTDVTCLCCNKNGIIKALIFLDGKQITSDDFKNIDPKTIDSVEILKNQKTIELYGEKAKDGVIVIKSKKHKKG